MRCFGRKQRLALRILTTSRETGEETRVAGLTSKVCKEIHCGLHYIQVWTASRVLLNTNSVFVLSRRVVTVVVAVEAPGPLHSTGSKDQSSTTVSVKYQGVHPCARVEDTAVVLQLRLSLNGWE